MKGNKLKKILTGALVTATMLTGLTACGGSGSDGGNSADGKKGGKAEKLTMLVLGNKPTNGRYKDMLKELNKKFQDKGVNAELDLFYVEWADWQTQYNTQLIAGDGSIDMITTATDWLYAWENTEKGAFMELSEDMLKENAPKTYEQIDKDGDWDIVKYTDGKVYFIPEDNYTQFTNHGFFYRGDWAKEAGFENGEITKFEDFTKYFQWVKDNKEDVIPWDVIGANLGSIPLDVYSQGKEDYRNLLGLSAGNYALWETTESDPYTITSHIMESDEYIEGAKLAKQWNDMGVWREDVLNYDGDTREEFFNGQTATDQHHAQTFYGSIYNQMNEKQPGSDPKFFYWGQENGNVMQDIKTHGALAISATSKNPELALQAYDLIRNDEECYRLMNYGILDKDYIVTEDGKLDFPEGYDVTKDALEANFWAGRMDEFELDKVTDMPTKHEMIDDLMDNSYEYQYINLIFDKTEIESYQSAFASILSEYLPQLGAGKFDDPEAKVKEMRKKLKDAGYDEVRENLQKQLDEWAKNNKVEYK